MIVTHAVPMTTAADLAKRQAWVEKCFTSATPLPLSFVSNQKKIIGIPDAWPPITQQRRNDANRLYPHTPFRLPAAPEAGFTIYPQAIDPAADYRFENAETGETHDLAGQALQRDGFPVTLPVHNGVIWFHPRTYR